MKSLLVAFALLSSSAFAADKVILECVTPGDALEVVQLIQKGDSSVIHVEFLVDDTSDDGSGNVGSEDYSITTGLKNIIKGDSDTLIGLSAHSESFGGGRSNAVLMRVLPNGSSYLAKDGIVYNLNCHK
ncbi:MAG: hypothetical protein ACJ76H_05345 [Bacteriovoracaceae bacterium]